MSIEPERPELAITVEQSSEDSFERPSPLVCLVWLASRSTFWLIVIAGLVIARSFGLLSAEVWQVWVFSPSLAWLIPPAHIVLRLLPYRGWGYKLRQHDLLVRRGVITRVYVAVPLARIQQVDTSSSLFERLLGLTTLVVRTAGTRAARTRIPGLPTEYATMLRDELSRKGDELAE
ncbi:MAG: PH domain-containing protein [Gammaproteobacteria bacterium]|nr:PH domain-containing protein [Gammaproteobacteria bacterium]